MATDDFFRARLDQMIRLGYPLAVLPHRVSKAQIDAALAPAFMRQDRLGRALAGSVFSAPPWGGPMPEPVQRLGHGR